MGAATSTPMMVALSTSMMPPQRFRMMNTQMTPVSKMSMPMMPMLERNTLTTELRRNMLTSNSRMTLMEITPKRMMANTPMTENTPMMENMRTRSRLMNMLRTMLAIWTMANTPMMPNTRTMANMLM